jgi:hypothetical protein
MDTMKIGPIAASLRAKAKPHLEGYTSAWLLPALLALDPFSPVTEVRGWGRGEMGAMKIGPMLRCCEKN